MTIRIQLQSFFKINFFIFAIGLISQLAQAEPIEDLIKSSKLQMKSRSHEVFNKWYQPYILRTYCAEIYPNYRGGNVPLITISGGSGVRKGITQSKARTVPQGFGLFYKIDRITEKCNKPEVSRGLLKHYWEFTGYKLENYISKLEWYLKAWISIQDPQYANSNSSTTQYYILTDEEALALKQGTIPDSMKLEIKSEEFFGNPEKDLSLLPQADPESMIRLTNQIASSLMIQEEMMQKAAEIKKNPIASYQDALNEYEQTQN